MNKYSLMHILTAPVEFDEDGQRNVISFAGINIPMIQRDYAHGRDAEKVIRRKFLDALFSALEGTKTLELDFVYGSTEKLDGESYFLPLDGQQRLTTLFLLHWYVIAAEHKKDDLHREMALLGRFSYATRPVARRFCERLCEQGLESGHSPRKTIENKSWFLKSYSNDPTVRSMLVMLDAIHELYQKTTPPLFSALARLQVYLLPMNGFGLSDELYIKMNARGKQLDAYESFKAEVSGWLLDRDEPMLSGFRTETEYHSRPMEFHLTFSLKMDNEWINYFWKLDNSNRIESNIKSVAVESSGARFLRFWFRYAMNSLAVTDGGSAEAISNQSRFKYLYNIDDEEAENSSPDFLVFQEVFCLKEGFFTLIEKALDGFSSHLHSGKISTEAFGVPIEANSFFDRKITQEKRLLFFAACRYFELNEYNEKKFRDWMRVAWNISQDPDIRSIPIMITVLRLLNDLAEKGSRDILEFLAGPSSANFIQNDKSFLYDVFSEERWKAALILKDHEWENELVLAERHPLFQGSVGFLIENCDDVDTFIEHRTTAFLLFSDKGAISLPDGSNLLMRACLSEITNESFLNDINFSDAAANWRLLLRRNGWARSPIQILCACSDLDEVKRRVTIMVMSDSHITAFNPIECRRVHENLYKDEQFHRWLQLQNATIIKWKYNNWFACRPGAWYDQVIISGMRNQIINEIASRYEMETPNRCTGTSMFWGFKVTLEIKWESAKVQFEFDSQGIVLVGIRQHGVGSSIDWSRFDTTGSGGWRRNTGEWAIVKSLDYSQVKDPAEIEGFVGEINNAVFSTVVEGSLNYFLVQSLR